MYKIGSTSNFDIGFKKVTLIIRPPLFHILMNTFAFIFSSFLFYSFYDNTFFTPNPKSFLTAFFLVSTLCLCLYNAGVKELSELDLMQRQLIRKKTFFGICYKTIQANWAQPYIFKYEFTYDSYNKVDKIWLVASSIENKESRQLIRFHNKETFIKFQKIFNENFPENKILEWHD